MARVNIEEDAYIRKYDAKITSFRLVRIYYVYYGRNAWHSTWIKRYSNHCFQPSFDLMEGVAENLRKHGSVLYCKEIPGLLVQTNGDAVLIAQINTDNPFSELQFTQFMTKCNDDFLKKNRTQYTTRKYLIDTATTLSDFLRCLRHNSNFWRSLQPLDDSLIVEDIGDTSEDYMTIYSNPLTGWKSEAHSGKSLLDWLEIENMINASYAQKLLKKLKLSAKKDQSLT